MPSDDVAPQPPLSGSAATRDGLVREAVRLFGERGYSATSLDAVASAAGVTKGALYHHFTGKRDLFTAAFEQLEHDLLAQNRRNTGAATLSDRHTDGLRLFLDMAREPGYVQIVLRDAPSVLGWTTQDPSHRPGFPVLTGLLRRVVGPDSTLDEETLTMLSRMVFSAVLSAASAVAAADDPDREVEVAERSLHMLIAAVMEIGTQHDRFGDLGSDAYSG